ncbi:MAG TPA: diguanylate cyclase, partial [Terriglobia bacterium]|nr:diguanylate cyclase [Terriglobia bacterium]
GRPLTIVEREIFGFDHQEVGSELLKLWGMPETVYMPVRYHHDVDLAPIELRQLCHVIRASDRLSAVYYGSESVRNVRRSKELLENSFGLGEDRVIRLIDAVAQKSGELLSQFNMPSGKMKTYSQILESANEELIRLNLSSESLIVELKEARKRAELLAAELKVANSKLRDKAFKDDLTGLYNHRYFLEILDIELESTRRFGHLLSLLMFDVDNFKGVNDTYGHRAGDEVLKTLGQYLNRSSRASDTAARYGGDEFVVLLRGTAIEGARVRAEAIRSEISGLEIKVDGITVSVTVSIGIAFFDQKELGHKNNFINLVDKAMYESKRGGRNRVSISKDAG